MKYLYVVDLPGRRPCITKLRWNRSEIASSWRKRNGSRTTIGPKNIESDTVCTICGCVLTKKTTHFVIMYTVGQEYVNLTQFVHKAERLYWPFGRVFKYHKVDFIFVLRSTR